jgi:hypothetical protein
MARYACTLVPDLKLPSNYQPRTPPASIVRPKPPIKNIESFADRGVRIDDPHKKNLEKRGDGGGILSTN